MHEEFTALPDISSGTFQRLLFWGGIALSQKPAPDQEEFTLVCDITSCGESYELSRTKTVISITRNSGRLQDRQTFQCKRRHACAFRTPSRVSNPPS
jgi:hypothetical protein